MSRTRARLRPRSEHGHDGPYRTQGEHYGQVPVAQALPRRAGAGQRRRRWTSGRRRRSTPTCSTCSDFAARLESTGEFVDGQALSPDGVWVRSDGEGRPPVTDGPFAETKDLIAGWMVIDVDSYERAIELAGELSAAPGRRRRADPRVARGPTVPGRAARRSPSDRWTRSRCASSSPAVLERPRPSRSRLRDGRGRRAGGPDPRPSRVWPDEPPRDPDGLADHGRLAQASSTPPGRTRPAATARSGSTPNRRPARSRAPTTRCACTSCARIPT